MYLPDCSQHPDDIVFQTARREPGQLSMRVFNCGRARVGSTGSAPPDCETRSARPVQSWIDQLRWQRHQTFGAKFGKRWPSLIELQKSNERPHG